MTAAALPGWAHWRTSPDWTLGVEEEVMLLEPHGTVLAHRAEELLPALSPALAGHVTTETHAAALELATGVHRTPAEAAGELASLRLRLAAETRALGNRPAALGTHPCARADEIRVSGAARHQLVYSTMRELARREPTFALHVHVGVRDPDRAMRIADRLRAHLPLLLALSANSPYWHGRDTGLQSARTPLFAAFPRTGIPRGFGSYEEWVAAVRPLIDGGAIPDPTFLWWDVRPQPRLGTVEVRVMDAQTSVRAAEALVALTQALARLEDYEDYAPAELLHTPEALAENRFLAARDGLAARFVLPGHRVSVPARELLAEAMAACRPHAAELGSLGELALIEELADDPPAARQRRAAARGGDPSGAVLAAAAEFARPTSAAPDAAIVVRA